MSNPWVHALRPRCYAAAALLLAAPAHARGAEGKFLDWLRRAERLPDPEEKIEYFNRAIGAWLPADGNVLLGECRYGRGKAYASLDHFDDAVTDWSEALKLDPDIAAAYLDRGLVFSRLGKRKEALSDLAEFVARKPEDLEGLLARGEAYRSLSRYGKAENDFQAAIDAAPSDYRGRLGLARTWAAQGRCLDALEPYGEAVKAAGDDAPEVLYFRAACEGELGRYPAAFKDFQDAIASLKDALNLRNRARQTRYRVWESQLKLAEAYFQRGRLHRKLREVEPAAADYAEACRLGLEPACKASSGGRAQAKRPAPPRRRGKPGSAGPGERIYAQ